MHILMNKFQTMLMYSFGPFFCYPWKPICNALFGTSYALSYEHFYNQHQDRLNLIWHLLAMMFQLFGNFVLLNLIDSQLPQFEPEYGFGNRWLSMLCTILWSVALIPPKDCPAFLKIFSVGSIVMAYTYAPLITAQQVELVGYVGFVFIWMANVVLTMKPPKISKDAALILVVLVARGIVDYVIVKYYTGALEAYSTVAAAIFLGVMVLLGFKHEPIKELVSVGVFGTHFVALTTNNPILYALGNAYTATLFQGLAHSLSGEEGTLLKLNETPDADTKLTYEWGHIVFFPNILLHAVYDHIKGHGNSLKLKKRKIR